MAKLTFNFLNKKKKINIYFQTEEYEFFENNKKIIDKVINIYPPLQDFGFYILCNNILIRAFQNKEIIESQLDNFKSLNVDEAYFKTKELLKDRPYVRSEDDVKIYLPQFSKALNYLYTHDPYSLNNYPYTEINKKPKLFCIDLFDEYGYQLFESDFSSLILIKKGKTSAAFYEKSFETIYIINDQGRLDSVIPIFDKYLKQKDETNIIERINRVIEFYYSNDRNKFIRSLYSEKLISDKMYHLLLKNASLRALKKEKLIRKKTLDD